MTPTIHTATAAELRDLSAGMMHNDNAARGERCNPNPRRMALCTVCHPKGR